MKPTNSSLTWLKAGLFLALLFWPLSSAMASMFGSAADWQYGDETRSAYLSLSRVNGEANELVYCHPPYCPTVDWKLSQLIWQIKDVDMLGAGLSFTSSNGVSLNLDGKFRMTEGRGAMDDYDWLYNTRLWSDWSHHEDTDVVTAQILDANIAINLSQVISNRLSLLLGYRQEIWGWVSRGGFYIYSNGGFRNDVGTFPDGVLAISYEQKFSMPYLGLRLDSRSNNLTFNAEFRYSNKVNVSAIDHHHMRDLLFEQYFDDGVMTAYMIGISYEFDNLGLHLGYQAQVYDEVRGNLLERRISTGELTGYCQNCIGADNTTKMLTLGLSMQF